MRLSKFFIVAALSLVVLAGCKKDCQHEHTHERVATASTCETAGSSEIVCDDCDAVISTSTLELAAHTVTIHATCTDDAYCDVCDEKIEDATGHKYEGHATCVESIYCEICNEKIEDATGHKSEGHATCVGSIYCEICDALLEAALGHSYSNAVLTYPTRTATGLLSVTCVRDNCNYAESITLPKLSVLDYTVETLDSSEIFIWKNSTYGTVTITNSDFELFCLASYGFFTLDSLPSDPFEDGSLLLSYFEETNVLKLSFENSDITFNEEFFFMSYGDVHTLINIVGENTIMNEATDSCYPSFYFAHPNGDNGGENYEVCIDGEGSLATNGYIAGQYTNLFVFECELNIEVFDHKSALTFLDGSVYFDYNSNVSLTSADPALSIYEMIRYAGIQAPRIYLYEATLAITGFPYALYSVDEFEALDSSITMSGTHIVAISSNSSLSTSCSAVLDNTELRIDALRGGGIRFLSAYNNKDSRYEGGTLQVLNGSEVTILGTADLDASVSSLEVSKLKVDGTSKLVMEAGSQFALRLHSNEASIFEAGSIVSLKATDTSANTFGLLAYGSTPSLTVSSGASVTIENFAMGISGVTVTGLSNITFVNCKVNY